jgi:alpha-ribazole phosphatase
MELYLIRHPRPEVAPGSVTARPTWPRRTAAEVAELRPLLPADYALYASPLRRARLLAEALGTPRVDPRLMEIHFGEWEGRSFDEIGQAALDAWSAAPSTLPRRGRVAPPDGDPRPRLSGLPAQGQPARCGRGCPWRPPARPGWRLLGLPPEHWLGLDFACGEVTRLDLHDWGTVLRWFNR